VFIYMDRMDSAAHTRELIERGYTVFESIYDPQWVAQIRGEIEGIHAEVGSPRCHAPDNLELRPGVVLCAAGLAIRRLVLMRPRFAASIIKPEVAAAMRGALGQDMVLEVAGCVVSDDSRPFFGWHMHVGGVDDGEYRRRDHWPTVSKMQRVMTLTYLQDLTDDNGPMLILPRKLGDPTAPPQDLDARSWEGQVELRVPAGSLVAVDECTWHAVAPKRGPGLRMFVGVSYAARDAPVGGWADERVGELGALEQSSELLRSLMR
jgi:ectoine hydroxylase-related dioxygenase (phytanoyl-CoA dioxygenase family)